MTKELIEEALRWANGHPNRRPSELMRALADALESRQPSENDREALARVMDTLAYYHCRSVNPKADHPRMGYHAMTEDQREHLREKQREAAEEIMRMIPSLTRAAVPDAAPDAREYLHAKCDCVPDLGPAHCHLCSADGSPVEWANCVAVQQVTDAPETVEVAFKTVEVERLGHLLVQLSPATPRNGAATVRRLMEEMNIKEVVS